MKPDPHDETLTAYALGELPAEATEAMARKVWQDPEAQRALADVRVLSEMLTAGFAAETHAGFTTQFDSPASPSFFEAGDAPAGLLAFEMDDVVTPAGLGEDGEFDDDDEKVVRPGFFRRSAFWLVPGAAAAAAFLVWMGHPSRTGSPGMATSEPGGRTVFPVKAPEPPEPAVARKKYQRPDPEEIVETLLASDSDRLKTSPMPVLEKELPAPPAVLPVPPVVAAAPPVVRPAPALEPPPRPTLDELLKKGSVAPGSVAATAGGRPATFVERFNHAVSASRLGGTTPAVFVDAKATPIFRVPDRADSLSYAQTRWCLRDFKVMPPPGIVRLEDMINAFDYKPLQPKPGTELGVQIETASCPWDEQHQLVRVSLHGRTMPVEALPPCHTTFLIRVVDTPGNARSLLLFWEGLQSLLGLLRSEDTVALAVWGDVDGLVLPPTPGSEAGSIRSAAEGLLQGGDGPAGAKGFDIAEKAARMSYDEQGINRIVIVTDGPLGAGESDFQALLDKVKYNAAAHVTTSVLGLGQARFEGSQLTDLAEAGRGQAFRADSAAETRRLFSEEWLSPTEPLARNLDLQVRFNPDRIRSVRPLGFEPAESSDGAAPSGSRRIRYGQQVTALYEVVPANTPPSWKDGVTNRFARLADSMTTIGQSGGPDWISVGLRYDTPVGESRWFIYAADLEDNSWRDASPDFRLSAAAAGFGLILQQDTATTGVTCRLVRDLAEPALATDPHHLRQEFIDMVKQADTLRRKSVD